jgi:lysophospholipase L1-like esterase
MKRNIALLLITLLLMTITAEITVRVLQQYGLLPDYSKSNRGQSSQHVPAPKYRNSSNEKLAIEHDLSQPGINIWGTRDPAFDKNRKDNVVRIAVIGDSVSFGYGLPYQQTYPYLLQTLLQQQLALDATNRKLEVLNFAVSGYGLEAYQALYDTKVREFSPDLVVIGYVQNDSNSTLSMVQSVGSNMKAVGARKKISRISQFGGWFYETIRKIPARQALSVELQQYQRDENISKATEQLANLQRSMANDGVATLVLIFPYFIDFTDYPLYKVHKILGEFLQKNNWSSCDLLPVFATQPADTWRLEPTDYLHPNAKGAELAATAAYNCIKQYSLPPFSLALPNR